MTEINLSHLAEKWPSSFVSRSEIAKFSGGLIQPGTMANLDSAGQGPHGGVWFGRKKAYQVEPLIEWMERRISTSYAKPRPGKRVR